MKKMFISRKEKGWGKGTGTKKNSSPRPPEAPKRSVQSSRRFAAGLVVHKARTNALAARQLDAELHRLPRVAIETAWGSCWALLFRKPMVTTQGKASF